MEKLTLNFATATAHLEWDKRWQTEAGRADWLTPEADVMDLAHQLSQQVSQPGSIRVLDLGCGVGRHALQFAQLGFETYAIDGSTAGLEFARNAVAKAGLTLEFTQGSILSLPYADTYFDYVLAFNVIYHGDRSVVSQAIAEIYRVLQPGGIFQGTLLSKRHYKYGLGEEIAPHTFVIPDDGDKDHPHFYCNALELCHLFEGFEPLKLVDQEHEQPRSWHWHLIAEKIEHR
jgi:SAM-dependent methyltransferase